MPSYEKEEQRIKAIEAQLEEIKKSVKPAWRGLKDHPDGEELKMRLEEINHNIKIAKDKCGWFRWELRGCPEE